MFIPATVLWPLRKVRHKVSDEPIQADEAETDTQGDVTSDAPTTPPWGDDFQAEKAWSTIQAQRAAEKELKSELQRLKRLEEDENAWLEHGREKFPDQFAADDESPEDEFLEDDDEPEVMTKAEFKAWQAEQEAARLAEANQQQFAADLDRFVGDRELSEYGNGWIHNQTYDGPEDLEKAVNSWFDYEDELRGSKPRNKKAAHVVTGGKAVTGTVDYSEMTRDQINEHMVARARALDTQQ